ncbi:MAG: putative glycoside hydrolase [Campylobacterales bacterium]|nr:putative glycoside hydrolase [Campylobacterales bacterium]
MLAVASITIYANSYIRVLSKTTHEPIYNVQVITKDGVETSDFLGKVKISPDLNNSELFIKSAGYRQINTTFQNGSKIYLEEFTPKALYVSFWALYSKKRVDEIINIVNTTAVNSLVIDVKNEWGELQYISQVPLAKEIKASRGRVVKDLKKTVERFRKLGIYLIARHVVFKDDKLANSKVTMAIKKEGIPWKGNDKLSWTDPYDTDVHEYNIAIAEEIASLGFDEIQFDYIRFPGVAGLELKKLNIEKNRVSAITSFLEKAYKRLSKSGVLVSADVFGYACLNSNDTGIGQTLSEMTKHVDVISPMLYPSGYGKFFPHVDIVPVEEPGKTIYHSLAIAEVKDGINPLKFRPWLQAFQDYAHDKRKFQRKEIKDQIAGAEEFGSSGWMLWHPSSRYKKEHID